MNVNFRNKTKFWVKVMFYEMGDYMTIKNLFSKGKDDGHLE